MTLKKLLHLSTYVATSFALLIGCFGIPAQAATFAAPSSNQSRLEIKEVQENLYATGNTIDIKAPIKKDLVIAGNTLNIEAPVERSIMAAGNELSIDSDFVGGSVRVAGNSLNLTGNYNEDVIVAGNTVTIQNAKIKGDLVVSADTLILQNSVIKGKFYGAYTTLQGDLSSQIRGEIKATQSNKKQNSKTFSWLKLAVELSTILALALLTFYLLRRDKLENLKPSFDSRFALDLLLGLGLVIIPAFILVLGIFLQIYPLILLLWALVSLTLVISNFFLSIYIASILKNTFKLQLKMVYLVPISYFILLILNLLPTVRVFFHILTLVFLLANFGYLVRNFVSLVDRSLK